MEQAIFRALQDGIHTQDVKVGAPVGTGAFTAAVIERMGEQSSTPSRDYAQIQLPKIGRDDVRSEPGSRQKVGVDVFIETADSPEQIGERLRAIATGTPYELKMVSNRGTVVWPATGGSTSCVDHFRCRFRIIDRQAWHPDSVLDLLARIGKTYRWMHVEKLEEIDGSPAYTRPQGEN